MKSTTIRTIEQLNAALSTDDYRDFAILLNGGAFSRKEIRRVGNKYHVINCIDDTTQLLSAAQLFDAYRTNIGGAIKLGAFVRLKSPLACPCILSDKPQR
jgi:hypothetical protein